MSDLTVPSQVPSELSHGPHAYRVWEAWTGRVDNDSNRYVGLEVLPDNLFFVIDRSRHGNWGVGNDANWTILTVRNGLDTVQKRGATLYQSVLEAIAAWDSAFNDS